MDTTRRDFLKTAAGGSLVSMGLSVPAFLSRTAAAAPPSNRPRAKDTILVVVQLTGGNDGLNTVVPFKDPEYAKLRKTIKLPAAELKKINDDLGFHPSMGGLAKLLEDQALCVVQGVGYPNPSQSHFRSMDIWQAGSSKEELAEGWIGRALQQWYEQKKLPNPPGFHFANDNDRAPLALTGSPTRVPSITTIEDFQPRTLAASGADKKQQQAVMEGVVQPQKGERGLLDFVQRTAANTYASSRRLQEVGKNYQPKATYPFSNLANQMKLAAQLIDADLGARIFYTSIGGFDTHADQLNAHANLLRQLSDAMTAFYRDITAHGHQDRVLMMTFSEFGRRVFENGSRGTDHGSAAPMLLVGGRVKAGVVGKHPNLTDVEMGNLKHAIDFRQVYATILDQWLGVSSERILGKGFEGVDILRG
jgi:uncharacterized protein (DUF1501 family)